MVKTCSRCGVARPRTEFYKQDKSSDGLNPWCKLCYREWHRQRYAVRFTDEIRMCERCGARYQPKQRRWTQFCSRSCKDKARREGEVAARLAAKPERKCVHCGAHVPKSKRIDAKFCSGACSDAAHAVTRKMSKRARQARLFEEGLVSRREIASRDKYRCGICGGRVSMAKKHPDPLAPSIDHVVPLSLGGGNDPQNLQLAHLRCNLRKGNSL